MGFGWFCLHGAWLCYPLFPFVQTDHEMEKPGKEEEEESSIFAPGGIHNTTCLTLCTTQKNDGTFISVHKGNYSLLNEKGWKGKKRAL